MEAAATLDPLHHRSHEQLNHYWQRLRGSRRFPTESEVDPDELHDIWDSCFLISMDDVTKRIGYRYSYLGKDLIDAFGDDVTNPSVTDHLVETDARDLTPLFDLVVKNGTVVVNESEFVNLNHIKIRYRTCMAPLGANDQVTHILGVMRWRAY